jgi:hypothetical protein
MIVDHLSMAKTVTNANELSSVTLLFGGSTFTVAARTLRLNSTLLMHHVGLENEGPYEVQTAVSSRDTCEGFLRAMGEGSDLSVTPDNCRELSSLCVEFGADRLRAACDHFVRAGTDFGLEARLFAIGEQVDKLENEVGLLKKDREDIGILQNAFEALTVEVQAVKDSVSGEIGKLKSETERVAKSVSGLETLRREFEGLKVSVERLQQDFPGCCLFEFPMKAGKSLDRDHFVSDEETQRDFSREGNCHNHFEVGSF